jgi:hypothetical protein
MHNTDPSNHPESAFEALMYSIYLLETWGSNTNLQHTHTYPSLLLYQGAPYPLNPIGCIVWDYLRWARCCTRCRSEDHLIHNCPSLWQAYDDGYLYDEYLQNQLLRQGIPISTLLDELGSIPVQNAGGRE